MVARCWHFDGLPETGASERIHKYLSLRRTAICGALGFPPHVRTLRILAKIRLEQPHQWFPQLFLLRELLRLEPLANEILEQNPTITTDEINQFAYGLEDPEKIMNLSGNISKLGWFFQMPTIKRYSIARHYLKLYFEIFETRALFSRLTEHHEFQTVFYSFLGSVKSPEAFSGDRKLIAYLQNYIARWKTFSDALNNISSTLASTWPEPPLGPSERIVPLLSAAELEEEGHIMNHCVASYALRVMRGGYYVYRVLTSPRCSLGIQRVEGSWRIDQLRAADNIAIVDSATITMVEKWLHSAPRKQRKEDSYFRKYLTEVSEHSGLPIRKWGKNDLENFPFQ